MDRQVVALVRLGQEHLHFSQPLTVRAWRQKISRLYYAALNLKRALALKHAGEFSTDVSDHKNIAKLPHDFPERDTYATKLVNLRDDRNLADYGHLATLAELVLQPAEAESMVTEFHNHVLSYLRNLGVAL